MLREFDMCKHFNAVPDAVSQQTVWDR